MPTSPKPTRRKLWLVVGAVVAVALVGAGAVILVPRLLGNDITITGNLLLVDEDVKNAGAGCYGTGGYEDIEGGAQVVVSDAAGATLALGKLGAGQSVGAGECRFAIRVTVPAGKGFYSIAVGRRPPLQYAEADLARPLTLGLGSA